MGFCVALAATGTPIGAAGTQEYGPSAAARVAQPEGPLPRTCEGPASAGSSLTIEIRLTAEGVARVVFDHPKPETALRAGVMGQSLVCVCVDEAGNIKDPVKLMRASGAPVLDAEALEIGKTLVYPAGHPGCMRDTINFAGPND